MHSICLILIMMVYFYSSCIPVVYLHCIGIIFVTCQGRIQDFHLGGGGGGRKRLCANAHYEREIRSPFRQGSRALEALGGFNAL